VNLFAILPVFIFFWLDIIFLKDSLGEEEGKKVRQSVIVKQGKLILNSLKNININRTTN